MSAVRKSNIEALRILCMLYIVMHHFILHALPLSAVYTPSLGIEWDVTQILSAFCFCAVNAFILISGFFGIHPKFKSFLNLYLMCAFYIFILYHLHLYVTDSHINRWSVLYTIMPFSYNPGWWFVMCYVLLYVLSPILNAAIESFDKKKFEYALILLTIVDVYFGFYRNQGFVNSGYSVMHFIYIYFIGAYLKRHVTFLHTHTHKWRLGIFAVYIVGSLLFGGIEILNTRYLHNSTDVWLYTTNYNHPLIIVNSIALFMFFESLDFRSKFVNYIAPSVIAVYLLHESNWFKDIYYSKVASLWEGFGTPMQRIGILFGLAIAVFIAGICIDQVRKLATYPIAKYMNKGYEKFKLRVLTK